MKTKEATKRKALALVSRFEGFRAAPTGNFDGQLLSWGPLQWNVGQRTLMPVLRDIRRRNPEKFERIMGDDFSAALDDDQTFRSFVKQFVLSGNEVSDPWVSRFSTLSGTAEAQAAFVAASEPYQERARRLCEALGFQTERGYALCLDVAVQNGAPRQDHIDAFRKYMAEAKSPMAEWEMLKVFARIVALAANERWQRDVLSRKLTIAVGGGVVHGMYIDLDDYGISYTDVWYEAEMPCGIERIFVDGVELRVERASVVRNKLYVRTRK